MSERICDAATLVAAGTCNRRLHRMRRLAGRPGPQLVYVYADVRRAHDRAGRVRSNWRSNSLHVRAGLLRG